MTIKKLLKQQWEEDAIERFRVFLTSQRGKTYAITGRNVIPSLGSTRNFDYQLQSQTGEKLAIEVFRLVESQEDLAHGKIWGDVVKLIKEDLQKRQVKGYLISTPSFQVRKSDMSVFSSRMADAIENAIKNNPGKKEFESDGFEFHEMADLDTVVFSFSSGTKSIDPQGTASKRFIENLKKKNEQVAVADHERVLLAINWAIFVSEEDAIRALSAFDFEQLENIDKIYFEIRPGEFALIFDKKVVEALNRTRLPADHWTLLLLLRYLRYQLGDKKQSAFEFVKTVTKNVGGIDWLNDNGAKENLIHVAEHLLKDGEIKEAMWVIEQLKDDPNPNPDGNNDLDDSKGEHNFHLKVLSGEDPKIITTVRGHLCWLMQKVISHNKPEYYRELIKIIERYLREKNLYIRIEATIPLTELVRRRRAEKNQDGSLFNWNLKERLLIRKLAFKILRENRNYHRVLEALLHVFDFLRDLSEKEAKEVLELFLTARENYISHDLAVLIIYFALFRKKDYPDLGKFDSEPFIFILKQQIQEGESAMRSSLTWHFWKILQEKILPYGEIKDYLFLFWRSDYDPEVASKFGLVIEELSKTAPGDALVLFRNSILGLKEYIVKHPEEAQRFWINGTEEIIPIAAKHPQELISIVEDLRDIWLSGGTYIGNIQDIFNSYKLVKSDKEIVKQKLRKIYEEMKKLQSNIPKIDWKF